MSKPSKSKPLTKAGPSHKTQQKVPSRPPPIPSFSPAELSPQQIVFIRSEYSLYSDETGIYAMQERRTEAAIDSMLATTDETALNAMLLASKPPRLNVSRLFPREKTAAVWLYIVNETWQKHCQRLPRSQQKLVTIGWCWVEHGQLQYEPKSNRPRIKGSPKALKMVFIHHGDRRQPDALMRILALRQLGLNDLAATPSGFITERERRDEVIAKFHEQRRFADEHLTATGRIFAAAEDLQDNCERIIELLSAAEHHPDDAFDLAQLAFEAGKAYATIDQLKDEKMLRDNKKSVAFISPAKTGTTWIETDIQRFRAEHDGESPTARQLIKFGRYATRVSRGDMEVSIPEEEKWLTFRAFEKRVQRLVKRPRGRPRESDSRSI